MYSLEVLNKNSPRSFYKTLTNVFFNIWPLECKDYYGCNTVKEIENKIIEEYKTSESPFTILYIDNQSEETTKLIGSVSICKTDITGLNYGPWLSDLWVDNNYRNCGISKILLDNILYYANKKFNINKIYLWVDIKNNFIVELYEKYGFKIVEKTIYCEKDIYIMSKTTWNIKENTIYNQLLVNKLNND
jgi:RimJ/RimL family protein N-acetyltransferase